MKLLYVSDARIPSEKAHSVQIVRMCEALKRQGAEVTLLLPRRWVLSREVYGQRYASIFDYYGSEKFEAVFLPCIDLIFLPLPVVEQLVFEPLYLLSYVLSLAFYFLFKAPADAVLYCRSHALALFLSALKPRKAPLVLEIHSVPANTWIFSLALRGSDRFVVLTRALKGKLVQRFGVSPEKILVAPDAVGIDFLEFAEPVEASRKALGLPSKKLVGYVGRFHTLGMEKGLNTILEAMPMVLAKQPDAVLCLLGGPKGMQDAYRKKAECLGIADRVLLFDYVKPEQVKRFINAFDVCVLPFPWTEHFAYYASPMKLFEYMALGKPIVATNLPAHLEVLRDGENAVIVEHSNAGALANGILKVLNDKALARRLGETARAEAQQKYTWEKRAQTVLEFVQGNA